MFPHFTAEVGIATVVAGTRLIAYAIDDDKRWRRFLAFLLLLAITVGWWLLADGGVQVVLDDFGRASSRLSARLAQRQAGRGPLHGRPPGAGRAQ
jgi:hypothetical protein